MNSTRHMFMKMMTAIVTLGLCVSISVAEGRPLVDITLVRQGKPSASIVVAQNPTHSARLAALELQYHIQKITGAMNPKCLFAQKKTWFLSPGLNSGGIIWVSKDTFM